MSETLTTERIEDFAALREVEEAWLAEHLSDAIANLGYPVGCGIAPHPETMAKAARNLFNHYAMMVELARSAADTELLALRKRVEWQDISTAPRDRTYILAYPVLLGTACVVVWEPPVKTPPLMLVRGENIAHSGYWRLPMSPNAAPYQPTHWMPLPTPKEPS